MEKSERRNTTAVAAGGELLRKRGVLRRLRRIADFGNGFALRERALFAMRRIGDRSGKRGIAESCFAE